MDRKKSWSYDDGGEFAGAENHKNAEPRRGKKPLDLSTDLDFIQAEIGQQQSRTYVAVRAWNY
ncbi:MAG: hypothetical protein HY231_22595 [Acidobacteria bacterium]|nr:hypothetical protein [Acidobacteriota bacterium]